MKPTAGPPRCSWWGQTLTTGPTAGPPRPSRWGPQPVLLVPRHGRCPAVDPRALVVLSFWNTGLGTHLQEVLPQLPIAYDKGHADHGRPVHSSLSPRALCVPPPTTLGPWLECSNVVGTSGLYSCVITKTSTSSKAILPASRSFHCEVARFIRNRPA